MGVRFHRLVGVANEYELRHAQLSRSSYYPSIGKLVFLSHKTNDPTADALAELISRNYGATVYMAEWDDDMPDSQGTLPSYLMEKIRECDGFLVNVSSKIAVSMWIGYEIGGAHALSKSRAKYFPTHIPHLPSVLDDLRKLSDPTTLEHWVTSL